MFKLLLLILAVSISQLAAQNKTWELSLRTDHKLSLKKPKEFPSIPKGILEAIAYNSTHLRHIEPETEMKSCIGLPYYYGVMGLVVDSSRYFRNTLQLVADLSKTSLEILKTDPEAQILAYAKAYDLLRQQLGIHTMSPTDHIAIIESLSELPNNGLSTSNYAFQSHVYAILMHLNQAVFQQTFNTPAYTIDIEKYFGQSMYQIMSAPQVLIDDENAYDSTGHAVSIHGYRNSSLPCNDLGSSFSYVLIQDPADPSNYSSRNGSAITNVTIHTIQGSYAGAISWFKIRHQMFHVITTCAHPMDKSRRWFVNQTKHGMYLVQTLLLLVLNMKVLFPIPHGTRKLRTYHQQN